ncbi:glutaredoxin family protein [Candidatus Omnitrophota bacterium]
MEVKVYSTPACPYCKKAKEYLKSKGVSYNDIDVSQDQTAAEEMTKISGQMGVPVIIINDNVVNGFDKEKIDSFLPPKTS